MTTRGELVAALLKGWRPGDKPLWGEPCNGCGLCCIRAQCPVSEVFFGLTDLCPALERSEDGRYHCGLINDPTQYLQLQPHVSAEAFKEAAAILNGAGTGCDATDGPADRAHRDRVYSPESFAAETRAAWDAASPAALAVMRAIGARRP